MHRLTGATLGTVAVGLVTVFLMAGFVGGGLLAGLPSPSGNATKALSSSSGATNAVAPAARTYQTAIDLVITSGLPAFGNATVPGVTPVPQTLSFYTNITWGAISDTTTDAWLVINDTTTHTHLASISLNDSVNTHEVSSFNNNGVLYENYTWNASLDKATLGCTLASCADKIPSTGVNTSITVWVSENGASLGGGPAVQNAEVNTTLVSTYVVAGFLSPTLPYNGVPVAVEFYTNISWGYASNASTKLTVEVSDAYSPFTVLGNFSFNGSVNATNSNGFTSVVVFNGTVGGIPYSYTVWSLALNKTTLACTDVSCNVTLPAQSDGDQGLAVDLTVWTNESGASAGGLATATGPVNATSEVVRIGSTMINAGLTNLPLAYQPLPYVQTGWINASWVNPAEDQGNSTFMGYALVYDTTTGKLLAVISLNDSVNTVNAHGASLSYIPNGNGTTPLGTPFVNYTWSINFTATAASLGTSVPYDPLMVIITGLANGTGHGGVAQTTGPGNIYGPYPTFVQYPTTVSVAIRPALPAYVPIPYSQNFTLSVANAAINPTTTSITVNIVDLTVTKELASIPIVLTDVVSSTTIPAVDNQTLYAFSVDSLTLTCSAPACVFASSIGLAPSPTDLYGVEVNASVDGIGAPTNGSWASDTVSASFYVIEAPVSARLASPNPSAVIAPGNVTVSVVYSGSFISTVVLNIYSSTQALVLSEGFSASGNNFTWVVTAPGTYSASVVVTTAYAPVTHYFNATLTVSKVLRIYDNSTAYSNSTLIPGLSAAAAGTLLLVIGLVVGIVAALVLGRAVWGGGRGPTPPQAWEGKPGEGAEAHPAAGANTCSECGKSFGTPEELAAHGKTEHGME